MKKILVCSLALFVLVTFLATLVFAVPVILPKKLVPPPPTYKLSVKCMVPSPNDLLALQEGTGLVQVEMPGVSQSVKTSASGPGKPAAFNLIAGTWKVRCATKIDELKQIITLEKTITIPKDSAVTFDYGEVIPKSLVKIRVLLPEADVTGYRSITITGKATAAGVVYKNKPYIVGLPAGDYKIVYHGTNNENTLEKAISIKAGAKETKLLFVSSQITEAKTYFKNLLTEVDKGSKSVSGWYTYDMKNLIESNFEGSFSGVIDSLAKEKAALASSANQEINSWKKPIMDKLSVSIDGLEAFYSYYNKLKAPILALGVMPAMIPGPMGVPVPNPALAPLPGMLAFKPFTDVPPAPPGVMWIGPNWKGQIDTYFADLKPVIQNINIPVVYELGEIVVQ